MPFAIVNGEPITQMPRDLYIPPQALEVFLEAFEGPLDLLLYLIRRQNLDILDIPHRGDHAPVHALHRADAGAAARARRRIPGDGRDAGRDQVAHAAAAAAARRGRRGRSARRAGAPPAGVRALQARRRGHRPAARAWSATCSGQRRAARPPGLARAAAGDAARDAARVQGRGDALADVRAPARAARAAVGARAHERRAGARWSHSDFVRIHARCFARRRAAWA